MAILSKVEKAGQGGGVFPVFCPFLLQAPDQPSVASFLPRPNPPCLGVTCVISLAFDMEEPPLSAKKRRRWSSRGADELTTPLATPKNREIPLSRHALARTGLGHRCFTQALPSFMLMPACAGQSAQQLLCQWVSREWQQRTNSLRKTSMGWAKVCRYSLGIHFCWHQ